MESVYKLARYDFLFVFYNELGSRWNCCRVINHQSQQNCLKIPNRVKKRMKNNTHTHLTVLFSGLPRWAGTRKVKPIWILLKKETVSGSGISWAICKSAPRSKQITMPAPHHWVFYRPDALPATQPTASKHWRHDEEQQQADPPSRFCQFTSSVPTNGTEPRPPAMLMPSPVPGARTILTTLGAGVANDVLVIVVLPGEMRLALKSDDATSSGDVTRLSACPREHKQVATVPGWVTCLRAGIPSRYATSQLGQLSLASPRGRLIKYQLRLG